MSWGRLLVAKQIKDPIQEYLVDWYLEEHPFAWFISILLSAWVIGCFTILRCRNEARFILRWLVFFVVARVGHHLQVDCFILIFQHRFRVLHDVKDILHSSRQNSSFCSSFSLQSESLSSISGAKHQNTRICSFYISFDGRRYNSLVKLILLIIFIQDLIKVKDLCLIAQHAFPKSQH